MSAATACCSDSGGGGVGFAAADVEVVARVEVPVAMAADVVVVVATVLPVPWLAVVADVVDEAPVTWPDIVDDVALVVDALFVVASVCVVDDEPVPLVVATMLVAPVDVVFAVGEVEDIAVVVAGTVVEFGLGS